MELEPFHAMQSDNTCGSSRKEIVRIEKNYSMNNSLLIFLYLSMDRAHFNHPLSVR